MMTKGWYKETGVEIMMVGKVQAAGLEVVKSCKTGRNQDSGLLDMDSVGFLQQY